VIAATVAGLIGVLEFHTKPASLSLGAMPAAGTVPAAAASGPASTRARRAQASKSAAAHPAAVRTVTGPAISYNYGVLSVSVTVSGTKIAKVGIASINDGGNPQSQYIDQQSIPVLEQQALQAQSANIQGVSGASYTSAGFTQSLQGALHKLGIA
jgi:uncharacterized protein with FMN-binding domain